MTRATLFALLLTGPAGAAEPEPLVSLTLAKASAERSEHHILFRCDVALDNPLGRELVVRSNCFSYFDGLQLVVTTTDGKVLAQQPYISHQSVYSVEPRPFPVKAGKTAGELRFPVRLPKDAKAFKVRLVGTLPGSGYEAILSTETLTVDVKEPEKKDPPRPAKGG